MVGKYLEILHLGVGESTGLLRTNWEMLLSYFPYDNLWSISEIVDEDRKVSHVSRSATLISLCCGSLQIMMTSH